MINRSEVWCSYGKLWSFVREAAYILLKNSAAAELYNSAVYSPYTGKASLRQKLSTFLNAKCAGENMDSEDFSVPQKLCLIYSSSHTRGNILMSYSAAYHNWTEFHGHVLLTNDIGKYCFLRQDEFHDFAGGRLSPESKAFDRLQALGFLYQDQDKYISDFQHSMAGMKQCLLSAAHLMILVLTN